MGNSNTVSRYKIGCLVMATISLLSMVGCSAATGGAATVTETETVTESVTQTTVFTVPDASNVIASVRPSVVAIDVSVSAYDFFGEYTQEGAGSGWIIDSNGYIVTNNHVVEDAENIAVTLEDGRIFEAEAVYTDPFSDLAIIKIDAQGLPALKVGDSSALKVGQYVLAIGNSLDMGISATFGIVSAVGVSIEMSADETMYDLIQTDAAINPGNSGGPLVNMAGEVVGITSAKIADVGIEGMGYAISINGALPVLEQLITNGSVDRPTIGVSIYTIDQYIAMRYHLSVDEGVLVTEVVEGGPADTAGIKAGDVITAVDSKKVTSAQGLVLLLQGYASGQQVNITFYRGSTENTVAVTLG